MTPRERPVDKALARARTEIAREYYLLADLGASEDRPFAHKILAVKDQVHYSGDPLAESTIRGVLRGTARLVETAEQLLAGT